MSPGLFGNKGSPADGAEGRLDPADPSQTIRTESLFSFLQEGLAAGTLGRQGKLKEPLNQQAYSSKHSSQGGQASKRK